SLTSLDELRLLASFLWLPRESAPLRRLGLRIQPAGAGMARRATMPGPGFEVEMDNYRFSATTATRQAAAEQRRAEAAQAMDRLSAIAAGADDVAPLRPALPAEEIAVAAATHPLEDMDDLDDLEAADLADETSASAYATRELESIAGAEVRPPRQARPSSQPRVQPGEQPERAPTTGPRRLWPLPGLLRRGDARRPRE
ncbi:MAG TPA: hypothetical protein VFX31_03540, partial [Ktedonobacterales bacterium]|nr:hypothetical protein [Ktedonobacterales bacterium]